MENEQEPVKNNNPNYKTRRQLQEELLASETKFSELMARVAALESAKAPASSTQEIISALREDRETEQSAKLKRELDAAYREIEHLRRPETPTGPGIRYKGWVQAKEDSWDMTGYHHGPKDGKPGEVFMVDMPDYWPGCPFTPVLVTGSSESGLPIVAPHPEFQSH